MNKTLNEVRLIGTISKAIVLKQGQYGAYGAFQLSVPEIVKTNNANGDTREEPNFLRCVASGKLAEALLNFGVVGSRIYVSGKIICRSYDDKDGKKQYITEIKCNDVIFLSRPQTG